jgi:hypothetical protein
MLMENDPLPGVVDLENAQGVFKAVDGVTH